MKSVLDEAKKQGFSVVLLCCICYFMFNYFKSENKELRSDIREIQKQLKDCQDSRVNDILMSKSLSANSDLFLNRLDLVAVLPSKKEKVFS